MKKILCFCVSFFLSVLVSLAAFTPDSSPVAVLDVAGVSYRVMILFTAGGTWQDKGPASYAANVDGQMVYYIKNQLDGYSYYDAALKNSSTGLIINRGTNEPAMYNPDGSIIQDPIGFVVPLDVFFTNLEPFPVWLYCTITINGEECTFLVGTIPSGGSFDGPFEPMFTPEQIDWIIANGMPDWLIEYVVDPDWWNSNPGSHPIIDPNNDGFLDPPYGNSGGSVTDPGLNPYPVYPNDPGNPDPDPPTPPSDPPDTPSPNPNPTPVTPPTPPIDSSGIINAVISSGAGVQSSVNAGANLTVGAVQSLGTKVDGVKTAVSAMGTTISNGLTSMGTSIGDGMAGLGDSIDGLVDGLGGTGDGFGMLGGKIDGLGTKVDGVKTSVETLGDKIDGGTPSGIPEFSAPDDGFSDLPELGMLNDSGTDLVSSTVTLKSFMEDWIGGFFSLTLPTSFGKSGRLHINFGADFLGASGMDVNFEGSGIVSTVRAFMVCIVLACTVLTAVSIYKNTF